jgi:hypothetical protein
MRPVRNELFSQETRVDREKNWGEIAIRPVRCEWSPHETLVDHERLK